MSVSAKLVARRTTGLSSSRKALWGILVGGRDKIDKSKGKAAPPKTMGAVVSGNGGLCRYLDDVRLLPDLIIRNRRDEMGLSKE